MVERDIPCSQIEGIEDVEPVSSKLPSAAGSFLINVFY